MAWCNESQRTPKDTVNVGAESRKLPYSVFLICGDRDWPGVPSNAMDGPCSLGQLTL